MLQKIFFSYSRIDGSEFALKLALDLKKEGFDIWIDQEDIRAGSEWDIEIEKALETCDCLLFIETEKSVISNNVLDEVYYALEQRKKVIPLILRDSKTPFRLQRLQHIDFSKNYRTGLSYLINELKGSVGTEALRAEEVVLIKKTDKPFYSRYGGLLLIIACLVILTLAVIIYTSKNEKIIRVTNNEVVNPKDTVSNDRTVSDIKPQDGLQKNDTKIEQVNEKKITAINRNKKTSGEDEATAKTATNTNKELTSLNEIFAGDWQLADVEPKAEYTRGYLKIETLDEKVNIKSYMQFYYFKTNDTSFLSIFNAFAGCTSCVLEKEIKLTAEDVAIASHTYRTLKEDQPESGKAGDTILNASANKSIRASVTLHLINNKTVIIKVKRDVAAELAYGLVLKPFVYSFRFTKPD